MIFHPEGGLYRTEKNRSFLRDAAALGEAAAKGTILEARAVLCDEGHNLFVDLGRMEGIIPREEGAIGIDSGKTRDIALLSRVNKIVCFVVTGFERRGGKTVALLSRKRAQERCADEYLSLLRSGDVIPARVTHLEPFGCFVDVGCGISSLIPIDAISVSRISHPSDRFYQGQPIFAAVKGFTEDGKLCLTHKELLGTWKENAARFHSGETVSGIIRSIESYGIFVELAPNLAGLAERREGVRSGQFASVFIKSLIPEKMKVKLVIVDAFDAGEISYRYDYTMTEGRIERWRYSPEECGKVIETVF